MIGERQSTLWNDFEVTDQVIDRGTRGLRKQEEEEKVAPLESVESKYDQAKDTWCFVQTKER